MESSNKKGIGAKIILITLGLCGIGGIVLGVYLLVMDVRTGHSEKIAEHVLAIIAILYGIIAVLYEWRLHQAFESQKKDIKNIVLAVDTRFLGEWPIHFKDITSLVGRAVPGDELLIVVDSFGYSHFTCPDEFEQYFKALERARDSRVKIKFLLHSEQPSRDCLRLQIEKQFEGKFEEFKSKLIDYQKAYPQLIDSLPSFAAGDTPGFREEVMTLSLYVQNSFCRQLNDAVTGTAVDIHVEGKLSISDAVFFWMIKHGGNATEMVFAYPKYAGVGTGYAFQTREPRLMDIFSRQFNAKDKATKIKRGDDVYPQAAADMRNRKQSDAGKAAVAPHG